MGTAKGKADPQASKKKQRRGRPPSPDNPPCPYCGSDNVKSRADFTLASGEKSRRWECLNEKCVHKSFSQGTILKLGGTIPPG